MLLSVNSSQSYRDFLKAAFPFLSHSDMKRYHSNKKFKSLVWQLRKLDTDPICDILLSFYSPDRGRPAIDPTILLRSFIMMNKLGYTSIEKWCNDLKSDQLYQYILGTFSPPAFATHHDFINRFSIDDPHLDLLFPKGKNTKVVRAKLKKNEKWDNFSDEDSRSLCDKYKDGASFDRKRTTFPLECIFNKLAVRPSMNMDLINKNGIFCGDGSCLHIHSDPNGHQAFEGNDEDSCYRYTAPDADWGWDSDLESWYFGYTIYNLSTYNPTHKLDLPVYLSLDYASTHDAITSIPVTARFLDLNPDVHPSYMCFDSAMDSYGIYTYLRYNNITPIIDWNPRHSGKKGPYAEFEGLDPQTGVPICAQGHHMIRDGYDTSKMATKYRCPVASGKIASCPLWGKCSNSSYGRVIKTFDKTDLKLFGPVPYRSEAWKKIFKNRTCTERINNRILNHYNLQNMHIRNRSKNFFFLMINGICIHMDAWEKVFRNSEE